jgi:hypothetical protein
MLVVAAFIFFSAILRNCGCKRNYCDVIFEYHHGVVQESRAEQAV